MDILCTRCGEPWDVFSLVDDMSPEEAEDLKAGRGCPCCAGKEECNEPDWCDDCDRFVNFRCTVNRFRPRANDARYIQQELATILGDDIDGLAATMEDLGLT